MWLADGCADKRKVERLEVECLRCGHHRSFTPGLRRYQEAGECPRCAYVGWADVAELTEHTRRIVRSRSLSRRLKLRAG